MNPKSAKYNQAGHCGKLGRNSVIIENSFIVLHLKSLLFLYRQEKGDIRTIQEL